MHSMPITTIPIPFLSVDKIVLFKKNKPAFLLNKQMFIMFNITLVSEVYATLKNAEPNAVNISSLQAVLRCSGFINTTKENLKNILECHLKGKVKSIDGSGTNWCCTQDDTSPEHTELQYMLHQDSIYLIDGNPKVASVCVDLDFSKCVNVFISVRQVAFEIRSKNGMDYYAVPPKLSECLESYDWMLWNIKSLLTSKFRVGREKLRFIVVSDDCRAQNLCALLKLEGHSCRWETYATLHVMMLRAKEEQQLESRESLHFTHK